MMSPIQYSPVTLSLFFSLFLQAESWLFQYSSAGPPSKPKDREEENDSPVHQKTSKPGMPMRVSDGERVNPRPNAGLIGDHSNQ